MGLLLVVEVVDTGVNYECGFKPEEHIATFHADDNTRGYGRARLVLGTITNKGQASALSSQLPLPLVTVSQAFDLTVLLRPVDW